MADEEARLALIKAAMREELGIARLDELPMEDEVKPNRRRGDHSGAIRSSMRKFTAQQRDENATLANLWHTAINDGAFDDDDAQAVRGLDTMANGRLHAVRDDVNKTASGLVKSFLNPFSQTSGPRKTKCNSKRPPLEQRPNYNPNNKGYKSVSDLGIVLDSGDGPLPIHTFGSRYGRVPPPPSFAPPPLRPGLLPSIQGPQPCLYAPPKQQQVKDVPKLSDPAKKPQPALAGPQEPLITPAKPPQPLTTKANARSLAPEAKTPLTSSVVLPSDQALANTFAPGAVASTVVKSPETTTARLPPPATTGVPDPEPTEYVFKSSIHVSLRTSQHAEGAVYLCARSPPDMGRFIVYALQKKQCEWPIGSWHDHFGQSSTVVLQFKPGDGTTRTYCLIFDSQAAVGRFLKVLRQLKSGKIPSDGVSPALGTSTPAAPQPVQAIPMVQSLASPVLPSSRGAASVPSNLPASQGQSSALGDTPQPYGSSKTSVLASTKPQSEAILISENASAADTAGQGVAVVDTATGDDNSPETDEGIEKACLAVLRRGFENIRATLGVALGFDKQTIVAVNIAKQLAKGFLETYNNDYAEYDEQDKTEAVDMLVRRILEPDTRRSTYTVEALKSLHTQATAPPLWLKELRFLPPPEDPPRSKQPSWPQLSGHDSPTKLSFHQSGPLSPEIPRVNSHLAWLGSASESSATKTSDGEGEVGKSIQYRKGALTKTSAATNQYLDPSGVRPLLGPRRGGSLGAASNTSGSAKVIGQPRRADGYTHITKHITNQGRFTGLLGELQGRPLVASPSAVDDLIGLDFGNTATPTANKTTNNNILNDSNDFGSPVLPSEKFSGNRKGSDAEVSQIVAGSRDASDGSTHQSSLDSLQAAFNSLSIGSPPKCTGQAVPCLGTSCHIRAETEPINGGGSESTLSDLIRFD